MEFRWNEEKNNQLQKQRGISFERVVVSILNDEILDVIQHPNKDIYPNQKAFIVNIDQYAYSVPFIIEENGDLFLKTIYPSRKYTKLFNLRGNEHEIR
ncbi:toxin [bacterium]|nr:MAG: toxin [bacterium]